MITNRISALQTKLEAAANLPETTRAELLGLLGELRREIDGLSAEQRELADQTASALTPAAGEESQAEVALGDLQASVAGLEVSHPRMVEIVNRVAVTLSNMGI